MDYKFMLIKNKYKFLYKQKMMILDENFVSTVSEEISLFIKELTLYGITLKSLCNKRPEGNEKDLLLNIAFALADNNGLSNLIQKHRALPIKRISKFTYESASFIEKWQSYIISYYLIVSKSQYSNIKNYLNIQLNDINQINDINDNENNFQKNDALVIYDENHTHNLGTGVLLKTFKDNAIILNSYGDFIKIKLNKEDSPIIGAIINGEIIKSYKIHKSPILASSISLILLLLVGFALYTQASTTIILDMDASIKIQVNKFNKIISVTPNNSNGKKIISSLKLEGKAVDESIYNMLNKAKELEIIKEKSIIYIYVNGDKLKESNLISSENFIKENKIEARINNSGNEYNINVK
ncbi:anti-sigma-I factor RsgI family protein [Clostridium amazonitimonense]|uniref:anti-sigma-I factor RsgI family protein n=1 Tax=Clostridium amazonitimonense TaxID=1499689 RepID=UPI000509420B|nr:anti-sigma factor domain-containing protein [Clostridium amazonitimonense]